MRVRTAAIGVITAIAVALAATACSGSGSGGGSLDEYFAEYERFDNAAETRTEQLQSEYADVLAASTLDETSRAGLQEYVTKLIAARRAYLDGISKLNPPEQAAAAHGESVAAYEAVLTAYEPIIAEIKAASSIADLQRIFNGQALTDAIARSDESCRVLQALADDAGINANLECPVAGA